MAIELETIKVTKRTAMMLRRSAFNKGKSRKPIYQVLEELLGLTLKA